MPDPELAPTAPPPFAEDFRGTVLRVRGSFTELLSAIGADASRPQDIARTFGINRNLSWKLSRIVHSTDPAEVSSHLPGASGLKILLATCAKHGASKVVCQRVADSIADFDRMVATHAGSRSDLEVMLSSLEGNAATPARLQASRRQAFLGNSAIWGVQGHVRLATQIYVPSATTPGSVDAVTISGLLGFRRLRPDAIWPLVQHQFFRHDEEQSPLVSVPLDPEISPDQAPTLREWSTLDPDLLHAVTIPAGRSWELGAGPVGRTGTVDAVFGRITANIGPLAGTADSDHAWVFVKLNTPVETLQSDLLVHRDLPLPGPPEVVVASGLEGGDDFDLDDLRGRVLPCPERLQDLGEAPPALASPMAPRYSSMISSVLARIGHRPDDFRGWRLTMSHPPVPSRAALRIPLHVE